MKPSVAPSPENQRRLFHYLRSGRIHPALLLVGPNVETKLLVAKNMAKLLLCQSPPKAPGYCGKCSPCQRIDKEIHPDVLILRADGEESEHIKIDSIRNLCHEMEIGPLEGSIKICIIDECHRMTTASANAFLKTLEEPGPGRYFWLLTSQVGSLLPTVLSRCLPFTFRPEVRDTTLSPDLLARYRGLLEEALCSRSLVRLCGELETKEEILGFVRFLQTCLRDSALSSSTPVAGLEGLTVYETLARFESALRLEGRLRSNANYGLMLEGFLRESFLL